MLSYRPQMAAVMGWIRQHPAIWVLLGAVIAGQVLQRVLARYVNQPSTMADIAVLVAMLALAGVAVWVRLSLGNQLASAARGRHLTVPAPASLPARYAVADAPDKAVTALLAALDIALLLLVQSTLRAPLLAVAQGYVRETWAETAFVAVVVALALLILAKLYSAGAPVLVQLVWWGLDRVVPTAGFLGAHPAVAVRAAQSVPAPVPAPALSAPATPTPVDLEPTVASPGGSASLEPTVVTAAPVSKSTEAEATLVAAEHAPAPDELESTVVAHQPSSGEDNVQPEQKPAPETHAVPGPDEPTIISPRKPQPQNTSDAETPA